jgi:hypothetical protein
MKNLNIQLNHVVNQQSISKHIVWEEQEIKDIANTGNISTVKIANSYDGD